MADPQLRASWKSTSAQLQRSQDRLERDIQARAKSWLGTDHKAPLLEEQPVAGAEAQADELAAQAAALVQRLRQTPHRQAHDNNIDAGADHLQVASGTETDTRPAELVAFEDFDRKHGSTGAWSREDHAEYLKIVQACRGNLGHVQRVCEELLLGKAESVAAHIRWHEQYLQLQERHRSALAAWRRERAIAAADTAAIAAAEAAVRSRREQARQAKQDRLWEAHRQQQRDAVQAWKEARAHEQQQSAAQQQQLSERQTARQRQLQDERRAAAQAEIEAARRAKQEQEAQESDENAAANSLSPTALLRVAWRNEAAELRQAALRQAPQAAQQLTDWSKRRLHAEARAAVARIAVVEPEGSFERAAGLTQAAQQRLEAGSDEVTQPCYIRHLKGRAVPAWRQALR